MKILNDRERLILEMKKRPLDDFTYHFRSSADNILEWKFFAKCEDFEIELDLHPVILENMPKILSSPYLTEELSNGYMRSVYDAEYVTFLAKENEGVSQ